MKKIKNILRKIGSHFKEKTKYKKRSILYNLAFAFILSLGILAPDFLMKLFTDVNKANFDVFFFTTLLFFTFLFSLCKNNKLWFYFGLGLSIVFQSIDLHHMAFFGTPLNPFDFHVMGDDVPDIIDAGLKSAAYWWYVLPCILLSYAPAVWFFIKKDRKMVKVPYLIYILLALMVYRAHRTVTRKSINYFYPSPANSSFNNALNDFLFLFVNSDGFLSTKDLEKVYPAYKVEKTQEPTVTNIVLVMGESVTTGHLSLFGYERETTPYLESIKDDVNFVYKPGISGGVATHISFHVFFNMMREPGNLVCLRNKESNLFRMAKAAGYKTFYVSPQASKNLNDMGTQYIDYMTTKDDNINLRLNRDEAVLDIFKNWTWDKRTSSS